jgi:hypothetical protein
LFRDERHPLRGHPEGRDRLVVRRSGVVRRAAALRGPARSCRRSSRAC